MLHDSEERRILFVPGIWLVYSLIFCMCIGLSSRSELINTDVFKVIVAPIWFVLFLIVQGLIAGLSIRFYDKVPFRLTWLNVPLFAFLVMALPCHIYIMHLLYDNKQEDEEIPKLYFGVLQSIMPAIVIGNLVYPLPRRPSLVTAGIFLSSLNAFDIMDILEDLKFIHTYDQGWITLTYISITISIVLQAFPIGLDEDDEDDPQRGRKLKTFLSLVFTDICLLIVRCQVMHEEDSVEGGLNFAFKNVISAGINIYLLCTAVNNDI